MSLSFSFLEAQGLTDDSSSCRSCPKRMKDNSSNMRNPLPGASIRLHDPTAARRSYLDAAVVQVSKAVRNSRH
jgi:hypothetical protein